MVSGLTGDICRFSFTNHRTAVRKNSNSMEEIFQMRNKHGQGGITVTTKDYLEWLQLRSFQRALEGGHLCLKLYCEAMSAQCNTASLAEELTPQIICSVRRGISCPDLSTMSYNFGSILANQPTAPDPSSMPSSIDDIYSLLRSIDETIGTPNPECKSIVCCNAISCSGTSHYRKSALEFLLTSACHDSVYDTKLKRFLKRHNKFWQVCKLIHNMFTCNCAKLQKDNGD